MRSLVIGLDAMDDKHKKKVRYNFFKEFGIDLDSDEYAEGDLDSNWDLLIEKCSVGKYRESLSEYIVLFKELLLNAVAPHRLDSIQIIMATEDEEKLKRKRIEEFEDILGDYSALLDNYYIYEADVWLNAWLAIQYIKSNERRLKEAEDENTKTMIPRKPKTGFVDTATGYVKSKSEREYRLPFEEDADGYFCGEYLKYVLGTSGKLFWTEEDKRETLDIKIAQDKPIRNFKGYQYQANIYMLKDKDYSRFSYQRIKALENHESFCLEDKILFHKTVNGVWVRNIVNTMIDCQGDFDAEDYIYLIDQLCGCKSLVWQNLISCLFIIAREYIKELSIDGVFTMFYTWFSNIEKINFNLHRLTEGILYLCQRIGYSEEKIKKRCTNYLQQLELETGENVKKYWESAPSKLRVTADINKDHKRFEWIYAIFQREVIDKTKCLYRDNQFSEKSLRKDISVEYNGVKLDLKNVLMKYSNFHSDLQRAEKELKEKIESNKEKQI